MAKVGKRFKSEADSSLGPVIEQLIGVGPLVLQSAKVLEDLNSFGLIEPLKQGVTATTSALFFLMLLIVALFTQMQMISLNVAWLLRNEFLI